MTKIQKTIEELDDLNRTTWLTAWSHTDCQHHWGLERPVSDWLIDIIGPPPFASRISFFTRNGIAARAAWIDVQIATFLSTRRQSSVEVWCLGAGFDSRWQKLLSGDFPQISRYREFDFPSVFTAKSALLDDSPWETSWMQVVQHPGNVTEGLPYSLPETDNEVLIIIEGLIDYLDEGEKRSLLSAIRQRVPGASVLLDAQSSYALHKNNKRLGGMTGSEAAKFAWAPDNPRIFYGVESGYEIIACHALFPELLSYRWPLVSWLPLPRRLREGYCLFHLKPDSGNL